MFVFPCCTSFSTCVALIINYALKYLKITTIESFHLHDVPCSVLSESNND